MTPRTPTSTLFPYTTLFRSKLFKIQKSQLLKNKTELKTKTKQIAELFTKNESLKKEVQFYNSKNTILLTNESVFAVEKKKYRSEEHTSELQSRPHLVCRLLL